MFCKVLVYNNQTILTIGVACLEHSLKDKLSKVLFHGTLMDRAANIILDGIDFDKLNDRADFGKGFYLTDSYALAQYTALTRYKQEKMSNGTAYPPVVIRVKLYCNNFADYSIKEFYGEDNAWKRFICCNRWFSQISKIMCNFDHNTNAQYDIVIGLTADGKMSRLNKLIKEDNYSLSDPFINGIKPFATTYTKLINNKLKRFETKADQISIHNEEFARSCMKYKDYDIIRIGEEDGYYE